MALACKRGQSRLFAPPPTSTTSETLALAARKAWWQIAQRHGDVLKAGLRQMQAHCREAKTGKGGAKLWIIMRRTFAREGG